MIKQFDSIKDIDQKLWDSLNTSNNPFTSYSFFLALEVSESIGNKSGWLPKYFLSDKCASYIFIKSHSYGEYIFDWSWAQAYETHGINYYPKLTSMAPFSPVSVPHFLGQFDQDILDATHSFYEKYNFTSIHYLFLEDNELKRFKDNNYPIRESFQYYFKNNNYSSFDDLLKELKSKKKKQILKERSISKDVKISLFTNEELNIDQAKRMFSFYQNTIAHKGSIQYLTEDFFIQLFKHLKSSILYIEASLNDTPVAGSLFLYSENKLFGRYWGCNTQIKNLHFELCYYRGIDFCISNKINNFEAGAQGEHKIKRGFRPTKVYSAHKIKDPNFHVAIQRYIDQETQMNRNNIDFLKSLLPFKSDQES